jgi:hypothetical protein
MKKPLLREKDMSPSHQAYKKLLDDAFASHGDMVGQELNDVISQTLYWAITIAVYGYQAEGRAVDSEEIFSVVMQMVRKIDQAKREGDARRAQEKGPKH